MVTRALPCLLALVLACNGPSRSREAAPPPEQSSAAAAAAPATRPTAATGHALPALAGLRYLELVTGGAHPADRLPMVVMIHGLGDSPGGPARLFEGYTAPARIILPQGPIPWGDRGFAWFEVRVGDARVEQLAAEVAEASERLELFLASIRGARPTRGRPVVAGFSQGGILTFAIASRAQAEIALALPLSGWLPPPLWPRERAEGCAPIQAFHGTLDEVVPLGPTQDAVRHLRRLGTEVTLTEFPGVSHRITPAVAAAFFEALTPRLSAEASRSD